MNQILPASLLAPGRIPDGMEWIEIPLAVIILLILSTAFGWFVYENPDIIGLPPDIFTRKKS